LRHAKDHRKQSLGHAASRTDGPEALSRNELVWKAHLMKIVELFKEHFVVWVWNHTPDCAEMSPGFPFFRKGPPDLDPLQDEIALSHLRLMQALCDTFNVSSWSRTSHP
jgi:hypothetical protein